MNYRYEYTQKNRRASGFLLFETFSEALSAVTSTTDPLKINRHIIEVATNKIICSMSRIDSYED